MARKSNSSPRVTIPPAAPPSGDDGAPETFEPEPDHGQLETFDAIELPPAFTTYRETGDAGALADASLADWSWQVYRVRGADEVSRERHGSSRRVWMMRLDGPLELSTIRRECGGGTFEIWGYYERRLRTRLRQDIAGPRKTFDRPEPAAPRVDPPAGSSAAAPRTDTAVLELLERQGRLLERLAERVTAPAPQVQGFNFADVFALAERMNERTAPSPGGEVLKELVGAFKMGMEVKADANGTPERSVTEIVLDRLVPLAEKIAVSWAAVPRRGPAPRPQPAGEAGESRAEVVTDAPAPDPDAHRWPAVVEALANAIASGTDPATFCDTLELLLPLQEVALVRAMPADQLIAQLRANAAGRHPILASDQAAGYVQAVLGELNRADEVSD